MGRASALRLSPRNFGALNFCALSFFALVSPVLGHAAQKPSAEGLAPQSAASVNAAHDAETEPHNTQDASAKTPQTKPEKPAIARPAARVAVGGMASIDCASIVVYASAPDTPHRLNATYAFPDRARWWLGLGDGQSPERVMRLRFGDAIFAVENQASASRELLAGERTEAVVQLEMRRALLSWPHGFDWKREANVAHASIAGVGKLTARFTDAVAATPIALEFTADDGKPGDSFRAIQWRDDKGKAWPVSLELWHDDARVWSETVRTVDTQSRFIDSFFLPPDKRDGSSSRPLEVGNVRSTDLPECRVQRIPLKDGTTLAVAFEEWQRTFAARTQELASRGLTLEEKVTLEVDSDAAPRALLMRLAPTRAAVPEDVAKSFAVVLERPALTTFVMGLKSVSKGPLESLTRAVPSDATPGVPYLRFDPKKPTEHVLLVLPLVPAGK